MTICLVVWKYDVRVFWNDMASAVKFAKTVSENLFKDEDDSNVEIYKESDYYNDYAPLKIFHKGKQIC